jgi:hypothetical protein
MHKCELDDSISHHEYLEQAQYYKNKKSINQFMMANGKRNQYRNQILANERCSAGYSKSNRLEVSKQPKHLYVLDRNYATSGQNEDSGVVHKIPMKSAVPKSRNAKLRNSDQQSSTYRSFKSKQFVPFTNEFNNLASAKKELSVESSI